MFLLLFSFWGFATIAKNEKEKRFFHVKKKRSSIAFFGKVKATDEYQKEKSKSIYFYLQIFLPSSF